MPQAGGSATIYGILYQVLGASHWASLITLASKSDEQELVLAQVIIEPKGGGGDIVIDASHCRIVEQWKAKNDHGTWSVKGLVSEVFPDLYRAIDGAALSKPVEYRFITEGRAGRWTALNSIFAKIQAEPMPEEPLAALNSVERRKFLPDSELTECEFFEWMTTVLREHPDIAEEAPEVTHQKLWHLIANFHFYPGRTLEIVASELDHLLLGAVDFREQVPNKRRELCGLAIELAGAGEVTITADEFLDRAGINAESFAHWTQIQDRLRREILHRTRGEWQYQSEADVRQTPTWPVERPVLVFAGESGQGKTWQLAALALSIASSKSLVATVTATGDLERDLQAAVNVIWQSALGHDQELSLERLVQRRTEVAPRLDGPWLTVFVDDVLSAVEARRLVARDWNAYGSRLALSTMPAIARSLKSQFPRLVEVVEVQDFTLVEAQEHLRRCGHDWGRLPPDVRELLKRPLLARLFAELAADEQWLPSHEYELFETFWLRIRDARSQADHPGDASWMRRLAGTVLDESHAYPWTQAALVELQLPNEAQVRLETIGWLRRLDGDRVEVWHDRVLNWAVAEELVSRRKSGALSAALLGETIGKLWGHSERRSGKYLGYVPLDVLWLIGDSVHGLVADLPVLIEALEDAPSAHFDFDRLYSEHLPTLGDRVISGIVERVRRAPKGDANRFPRLAADAISKIGRNNRAAAANCGRELISDLDTDLQDVGMRILAIAPDPAALDRLWELHQGICQAKDPENPAPWYARYDASFTALRNGVRQRPDWLRGKIESSDPAQVPIHELAYLLASLEGEAGRSLWHATKESLWAKVPPDKLRSLARCIEHFRDDSEVERLEQWLTNSDDLLAPTALMALARIDPQRALGGLQRMDPDDLYMCRSWWLGQLATRCPGETQDAIRALMTSAPENRWKFALIYQENMHLMDKETLTELLNDLTRLAATRLDNPQDLNVDLMRPLMLLEDATSPELLTVFESFAGTGLEQTLVELARHRLNRATLYADHILDGVRTLLLKINGTGLTDLVNAELASTSKYSRYAGVEKSLMRPDRTTRELLRAQVEHDERWDEQGYPIAQKEAGIMLAALGENIAAVRSLLRWEGVLQDFMTVRRRMTPLSDGDLVEAIAAIESSDDDQRMRGLWALSISGRPDLAHLALDALRQADPASELAKSAVWALGELACREPEVIRLIEPHLAIEAHKYAAILALARVGTPDAFTALERCLIASGITPGHFHDRILAMNLVHRASSRRVVAAEVWKAVQRDRQWGGLPELFDCLAELDDPAVGEWLLSEAYEPDDIIHTVGRRAWVIRALAKLDVESAFRACESALLSGAKDCAELADALIDLDPERGVPVACRVATLGVSAFVRYAVGQSLRRVPDKELVSRSLEGLLRSENAVERKVAVELAGWVGPAAFNSGSLQHYLDDYAIVVRSAACNALRRHALEMHTHELLALLKESRGARAWSLLDAVLASANPHALQTEGDDLFIGNAYPKGDVPYWRYCRRRLDRRVKDIEKELADLDRKEDEST